MTTDSSGSASTTEVPEYPGGMPPAAARPFTPHPGPGAARGGGYGNIYTPHAGSMIIQVQRESGLQSRTIVLSARQIRILRFIMSRTGKLIAGGIAAIVVLLVVEAARIPVLTGRIARMEHTAQRLDTLEHSLSELQKRYDQVRTMMGSDAPTDGEHAGSAAAAGFAPAPAIQTRAPGGAATRIAAHSASRAVTATDAPADAGTPSNDAAGTDASADSGATATPAATPAAAVHHGRARSGAGAGTPQSVIVPPPPDSGTPPSPQAEPQ